MQKLQILQVSATKDPHLRALETEFEKRLQPYFKLETLTLSASKKDQRELVQNEEKESFLKKLDTDAHIIALDERGIELTSEAFAELIQKLRDHGPGKIQFLIGGSHGLHPEVLQKAQQKIALSKMTFTHEMVRVFLKEQLYRAGTILAGKTYHK